MSAWERVYARGILISCIFCSNQEETSIWRTRWVFLCVCEEPICCALFCVSSYIAVRSTTLGLLCTYREVIKSWKCFHTCMHDALILNAICGCATRWDQYCKTALQLTEANKREACIHLFKQIKDLSISVNRAHSDTRPMQMLSCTRKFIDSLQLQMNLWN